MIKYHCCAVPGTKRSLRRSPIDYTSEEILVSHVKYFISVVLPLHQIWIYSCSTCVSVNGKRCNSDDSRSTTAGRRSSRYPIPGWSHLLAARPIGSYLLTQMAVPLGAYSPSQGFHTRTEFSCVTAIFISRISDRLKITSTHSHCVPRFTSLVNYYEILLLLTWTKTISHVWPLHSIQTSVNCSTVCSQFPSTALTAPLLLLNICGLTTGCTKSRYLK